MTIQPVLPFAVAPRMNGGLKLILRAVAQFYSGKHSEMGDVTVKMMLRAVKSGILMTC